MRGLAWTLAVILTLRSTAFAEEPHRAHHPWWRRLTLAAACAASFWDLQTTRVGIGHGADEANPLFADSQGRPRWGRMIGIKAGTCVASFVSEERFSHESSGRFWIGVNSISAGSFAGIALRNLRIAGDAPH